MGVVRTLAEMLPGSRLDVPDRTPVLSVQDVHLRFGGLKALRGVSFDVRPDELFAIIGPNRAGKTSIFNCLSGVYRPQEGSISFLARTCAVGPRSRLRAPAWRECSRTSPCSRT